MYLFRDVYFLHPLSEEVEPLTAAYLFCDVRDGSKGLACTWSRLAESGTWAYLIRT